VGEGGGGRSSLWGAVVLASLAVVAVMRSSVPQGRRGLLTAKVIAVVVSVAGAVAIVRSFRSA
jgi:hypothetical protein